MNRNTDPVKLVLMDTATNMLYAYEDRTPVEQVHMKVNDTPIEYIKEAIEGFRIKSRNPNQPLKA